MYSERVMIWLLTRVTISSTTCPAAKAGRHAEATRTRQSLFIRFQWAAALPGLAGKRRIAGRSRHFTPFECILGQGPVSLKPGGVAELAGYPRRAKARAVRSSHRGDPTLNSVTASRMAEQRACAVEGGAACNRGLMRSRPNSSVDLL